MALTYAIKRSVVAGNAKRRLVDITTDASYAAGGYTPAAASCGLSRIDGMNFMGGTVGLLGIYNPSTGKLQFYKGASTVTVTSGNAAYTEAATNESLLNAATFRFEVIGDISNG